MQLSNFLVALTPHKRKHTLIKNKVATPTIPVDTLSTELVYPDNAAAVTVSAGKPVPEVKTVLVPADEIAAPPAVTDKPPAATVNPFDAVRMPPTVAPPDTIDKPPAVIVSPLEAVNTPPIVAPPDVTDSPPAEIVTSPSPRTLNISTLPAAP